MVLTPIKRSIVPSPLEDQRRFDDFVTQYLNKCDDLLSYTKRYPTVKQTDLLTVQRQNRNPHEEHRWLRRNLQITRRETTYDELRSVLFVNRAEHLPRWMPHLLAADCVETIVPNLCQVFRYSFRSQGLKSNRDYCQLVVMREFLGHAARPKPRIYTPSASTTNLALLSMRSASSSAHQSTTNLNQHRPNNNNNNNNNALLKSARSMADFQQHNQQQPTSSTLLTPDDLPPGHASNRPIRRFQVVTVPMSHWNCTEQRGFVRAFYESYEEVREYSDGHVEWTCIHHSDFSGWLPSLLADHSIATAFPKEAEALLDYLSRTRTRPLDNEY